MSRVTELEKALTTLFRKGTEVGYAETEIDEFLENIDYHAPVSYTHLDVYKRQPQVLPEQDAPCRYFDPVETGRFLFRVLYYGSRVHLETFHVLTDGTGAMQFLKAVCYRYCQLADVYKRQYPAPAPLTVHWRASTPPTSA